MNLGISLGLRHSPSFLMLSHNDLLIKEKVLPESSTASPLAPRTLTGTISRDRSPTTDARSAFCARPGARSGFLAAFLELRSAWPVCWTRLQYSLELLQSFSMRDPTLTTCSTVDTIPRSPLASLGLHAPRIRRTISSSSMSGLHLRQRAR